MEISVDISLYPLNEDYIPAIKSFIENIERYPDIYVKRNDLSTQIFGDYDQVMDILKTQLRQSWETWGKGVFVIKFLQDDLRGQGDT